jgi:hypothetical protein
MNLIYRAPTASEQSRIRDIDWVWHIRHFFISPLG